MRSLFTIHAGEYLVGAEIERRFKRTNVWIPSKDTGVDLLVSDRSNRSTVSLQVKLSKDFLVTHMSRLAEYQEHLRACGWWTLDRKKLAQSDADYWVFVLQGYANRSTDFVVIPRQRLVERLEKIHGSYKTCQTYLWVTCTHQCWETRGLKRPDQLAVTQGTFRDGLRDFTPWLNNWEPIVRLNDDGGER